jgi:N-sulfoglucosamine sulfohydrolase
MKSPSIRLRALLLLAFITSAATEPTSAFEQPTAQPNILLILSDDHSVPHLGCYGDQAVSTPNLDRFASQGMVFDKHFCVAPQCVPSRAGFMTGRSAVAARITRFSSPLAADVPALPDLLRAHGYYTGVCRRNFHLDGPERFGRIPGAVYEQHPELRTFDRRVDFLNVSEPREKTVPVVNEFLNKVPAGKPFFLWISFDEPHHPWDIPAPGAQTEPAQVVVPPYLPDTPQVRSDLARYYDEVAAMDEEFQWVMDILENRGLANNTLVVFIGDNGYAFPHGKGSLYDPGLNTPLIVRWPGKVRPGTCSSELISGEDITPTLLETAGAPVPREITGRSFLKLLAGETFEGRKYIFAERGPHGSFDENTQADGFDLSRCVRSQRFKLIYNCTTHQVYQPIDSNVEPYWKTMVNLYKEDQLAPKYVRAYFTTPRPVFELYDLENDPGELNNLAGDHESAEIERELNAALQEKMILDYDYLPLPAKD